MTPRLVEGGGRSWSESGGDRRTLRRRIAAGVVVGVALVGTAVGLAVSGGSGGHARVRSVRPVVTTPPAAAPVGVAPPLSVQGGRLSGCHLHGGSGKIPTSPPAVTWQLFNTVALPYSETAGPGYVTGDVARCFAHTPTGALIADQHIATRYLIAAGWRQVVAAGVVPGPGVNVYSAERSKVASTSSAGDYCQTAGFSFLNYTPERAQIEDVSRCGGNLQAVTSTVEWSGTDWRLVLQPDGSESPSETNIANLTGFIAWGGV